MSNSQSHCWKLFEVYWPRAAGQMDFSISNKFLRFSNNLIIQPITKERKIKEQPLKWIAFSKGHMFSFVVIFPLAYVQFRYPILSACHWILLPCDQSSSRKFWLFFLKKQCTSLSWYLKQTVRIQYIAGAGGTRVSPIIASQNIFGLPCGNNNDSIWKSKLFIYLIFVVLKQ